MLIDKISSTRQLVENVKLAEEQMSRHEEYDDFYQKLNGQTIHFDHVILSIASLQTKYPDTFEKTDMSDLLIKINELLTTFESEPKQSRITNFYKLVEDHSTRWEVLWNTYATEQSYDFIRGLDSIKQVADPTEDIDAIINGLNRLIDKWPLMESNISQFKRYITQAQEKLMSLNTSPAVQKFLERVANKSATIVDLTPEVIQWLKENNFENKLKISYK